MALSDLLGFLPRRSLSEAHRAVLRRRVPAFSTFDDLDHRYGDSLFTGVSLYRDGATLTYARSYVPEDRVPPGVPRLSPDAGAFEEELLLLAL